jgi:hypothetical protein
MTKKHIKSKETSNQKNITKATKLSIKYHIKNQRNFQSKKALQKQRNF